MPEEQEKKTRLIGYWLFTTTLIVFAAITAYISLWALPAGGTIMDVIRAGFPIWGITALAAIIIFAGYYFYNKRQAE